MADLLTAEQLDAVERTVLGLNPSATVRRLELRILFLVTQNYLSRIRKLFVLGVGDAWLEVLLSARDRMFPNARGFAVKVRRTTRCRVPLDVILDVGVAATDDRSYLFI